MPKGYEDLKGSKRPPSTFAWLKLTCTCEC